MCDLMRVSKDLQTYEAAVLAFLSSAHVIAAQLEQESHRLTAPLKAELHKAVLAQGSWRAAQWVALASQAGQ